MPHISVITPASRGIQNLSFLFRDFKNQTFQDMEHICVYDGRPSEEVINLAEQYKKLYNLKFCSIEKDFGDMHRSPGTKARNYGTSIAKGAFVVFCDDDVRFKDSYLEVLINGMTPNKISVVQVACKESRLFKNGNPNKIAVIPEIGLPTFPIICHVDTANCIFPRKWVLEDPWRYEPEHDYQLIKRIIEKHRPEILMKNGIQADLDGIFVKGIKDFVSIPPYFRL